MVIQVSLSSITGLSLHRAIKVPLCEVIQVAPYVVKTASLCALLYLSSESNLFEVKSICPIK